MKYNALIPVKSLALAKSRLASAISQHQRESLVLDMLHNVVRMLLDSEQFEKVSVVSSDEHVLELADVWGARAMIEEQHGHNQALHAAALRMKNEGVPSLLTISADLPLLTIEEIRSLLKQSLQHEVVLAPSSEGTGTNAILVRPPLAVPYVFGPNSLHSYLKAVRQRQLSFTTYHSIGLALDIDTIDDLDKFKIINNIRKEIVYGC